jgi:hypothetical protein
MKFRVLGHRKSDAHRITLEFEAESKAAAERNARKQGLEVIRVELAPTDADPASPAPARPAAGRVRTQPPAPTPHAGSGVTRLLVWLLILVAAAGAVYCFWEPLAQHIPFLPRP